MKYSLYFVYFVLVGLIVTSLMGMAYLLNVLRLQGTTQTAVEEKIRLAGTMESIIYSDVWKSRTIIAPGIESLFFSEMGESQDIVFIKIVHIEGAIKRSTIAGEEGRIAEDPDIARAIITKKNIIRDEIYGGRKIKLIIHPVPLEDATIWIGLSLDTIREKIRRESIQSLIAGSAFSIFIFLVLWLIFRSFVAPIKELTTASQEIREGNFDITIKDKSRTELGELSRAFNQMAANLKKSRDELEESKNVLEVKVQARTRELKELAENLEIEVRKRTKEVYGQMEDSERFQKLAVGRELKMVELKAELERLKNEKKQKILKKS